MVLYRSPAQRLLYDQDVGISEENFLNERRELEEHRGYSDSDRGEALYPVLSSRIKKEELPFIAAEDVKRQDGTASRRLWIVVDDTIYDCSEYIEKHPGGRQIMRGFGGQDCSWQWWSFHGKSVMDKVAVKLRVGRTSGVPNSHKQPKRQNFLRTVGDEW